MYAHAHEMIPKAARNNLVYGLLLSLFNSMQHTGTQFLRFSTSRCPDTLTSGHEPCRMELRWEEAGSSRDGQGSEDLATRQECTLSFFAKPVKMYARRTAHMNWSAPSWTRVAVRFTQYRTPMTPTMCPGTQRIRSYFVRPVRRKEGSYFGTLDVSTIFQFYAFLGGLRRSSGYRVESKPTQIVNTRSAPIQTNYSPDGKHLIWVSVPNQLHFLSFAKPEGDDGKEQWGHMTTDTVRIHTSCMTLLYANRVIWLVLLLSHRSVFGVYDVELDSHDGHVQPRRRRPYPHAHFRISGSNSRLSCVNGPREPACACRRMYRRCFGSSGKVCQPYHILLGDQY